MALLQLVRAWHHSMGRNYTAALGSKPPSPFTIPITPMKIPHVCLTFASVVSGCVSISAAQDDSSMATSFLRAIRQVESGDRCDGPPGRHGELGAYQFRRQVWHRYT